MFLCQWVRVRSVETLWNWRSHFVLEQHTWIVYHWIYLNLSLREITKRETSFWFQIQWCRFEWANPVPAGTKHETDFEIRSHSGAQSKQKGSKTCSENLNSSYLIFENVVVESIGNISAHDCELQVSVFSESLAQSNIT